MPSTAIFRGRKRVRTGDLERTERPSVGPKARCDAGRLNRRFSTGRFQSAGVHAVHRRPEDATGFAGYGLRELARIVGLTARPAKAASNGWYCRPMAKIFLNHPVADYETWRAVFDQDAPRRDAYGLTNVSVLRDADDPNQIWLVADGEPDKVNEMMQDPGLASEMEGAGVTGPPVLFTAG